MNENAKHMLSATEAVVQTTPDRTDVSTPKQAEEEKIDIAAARILHKYRAAFEELAK